MPREQLLLVIRSFGGVAAWAGDGSPLDESDESITHQARPRSALRHVTAPAATAWLVGWREGFCDFKITASAIDPHVPGTFPHNS